jgi:hypothetical protein
MTTRLPNINFARLEAAVAAINPLFEDCCRYVGSHSRADGNLECAADAGYAEGGLEKTAGSAGRVCKEELSWVGKSKRQYLYGRTSRGCTGAVSPMATVGNYGSYLLL